VSPPMATWQKLILAFFLLVGFGAWVLILVLVWTNGTQANALRLAVYVTAANLFLLTLVAAVVVIKRDVGVIRKRFSKQRQHRLGARKTEAENC
jgi:high-affinity Fe2+/Pb2+ permease